ncbi:MAG: O-antigen ligase family protein [Calditrichia bacterium]
MNIKNLSLKQSGQMRNQLLLVSLCIFCFVLPWSLALMQIGLVLTMLSAIFIHVTEKRRLVFHPTLILMLVYILFRFISIALSPDISKSMRATFQQDWPLLAVPLLASVQLNAKSWRTVLTVLLVSATLVSLYGLLQTFQGFEYFRGKALDPVGTNPVATFYRATGGYNICLTYAGNQLMFFAFILGLLLIRSDKDKVNLLHLGMFALLFLSIVGTFARSAWLGIVLCIVVGTFFVNRRLFVFSSLGLLLIGVVASLVFPDIRGRLTSIFDLSLNEARLNLWHTSLKMILDNPFAGIGPGLFNHVFESYRVPGHYAYLGHSHNDFLNLAANSGLPALIAWIAIWVSVISSMFKSVYNSAKTLFQRQVVFGCLLAIVAIWFSSFFQCYYTDLENNIAWLFFTGLGLNATIQTWNDQES